MANSTQKLSQGRDAFAYEKALDGCWRHRKEFPQNVKGVPMLIKNNGLGAALAFMHTKDNTLGSILKAIDAWLSHQDNIYTCSIIEKAKGNTLIQKIKDIDSQEYRKLTKETMVFLQLLRRYSEGIIKTEEQKDDDMAKRQDSERNRASFAFSEAERYKGEEFSQTAKKVPMMIKTSGLSEAFAFMYSKQSKHGQILHSIEAWLNNPNNKIHLILKNASGKNLVQKVTELDISSYRTVTTETMAYLQWLRRFSEGMVKEEEDKAKNKNL